jgi:hypothetical protein
MARSPKPLLKISREDAALRLRERIDKAADLVPTDIKSPDDLSRAQDKEKLWYEYNSALISNLFSTNDFTDEYMSHRHPVHLASDRYIEPDLRTLADRFVHSVRSQLVCLRSIIDRLELIDLETAEDTIASQNESSLERLAERLPLVARQLRRRYKGRSTLEINDEYDVQNLLHALLWIYYDDVRKEEWVPSYAGGSAKIDFVLPTIKAAVETKKTRPTLLARQLADELLVDIARYQNHHSCDKLYCIVYDPDRLIDNPRGLEADLNKTHGRLIVHVMIVS